MELLRGSATEVHATHRVSSTGSGDTLSIFTRFIAAFSLSGREVQITGRQPPVIRPGDEVVVVGEVDHSGVVQGICYINVSRGVGTAEQGPFLWLLGGTLAVVLSGLVLLLNLLDLVLSSPAEMVRMGVKAALAPYLPILCIFVAGCWMLRRGRRIAKALRMIRAASRAAIVR